VSRWGWRSKPDQWHMDQVGPATSHSGQAGAYGSEVPEPLPGDEPSVAPVNSRDNRPRHYPTRPGGDRGRPSHINLPAEPEIPDVPEGLLLRLMPGEWTHMAGIHPADQVTMRVAGVHPDRPRADIGMVWVTGHGIECSWPSSTCSRPCFELLVSVSALWRAVGG
jgi:hypothetical protein